MRLLTSGRVACARPWVAAVVVLLMMLPMALMVSAEQGDPTQAVTTASQTLRAVQPAGDVVITPVEMKDILPCVCWSANGQSYYTLDKTGTVVRYTDIKTEAVRTDLGSPASWLSVSAQGVIVTMPKLQQVWVLDAQSLVVKKKIAAPSVERADSSPALSLAFATSPGPANDHLLSVLDLKAGKIVKQYLQITFGHAQVSPDGKMIFVQGSGEELVRYKIEKNEVILVDKTERIAQNGKGISISIDSKYVCLPSGGGNYTTEKKRTTFIYSVDNLKLPVLNLANGVDSHIMALDGKKSLIYGHSYDKGLAISDFKGKLLKEISLEPKENDARQYVVAPEGGKVLVLCNKKLFHCDTSALKGEAPVEVPVFTPGVPSEMALKALEIPGLLALQLAGSGLDYPKTLPCICWARDSQSFYTLENNGTVHQIAADGKKELARRNLDFPCDWMTMSKEGPVVTIAKEGQAWLLADDLGKVLRKINIPKGANRVISAPKLSIALAGNDSQLSSVSVLDLKKGEILTTYAKIPFAFSALSPNGELLFSQGTNSDLVCYKLKDDSLLLATKSDAIAQNPGCLAVSADSKFVAMTNKVGNTGKSPHATYVFAVDDLKKPRVTVTAGGFPVCLAFDPAGKWIFANGADKHLIVFDWQGIKHQEFNLLNKKGDLASVRQMIVQPVGGKILILNEGYLWLVELAPLK